MFITPEIRRPEEETEQEKKEWNNRMYEALFRFGSIKGSNALEDLKY